MKVNKLDKKYLNLIQIKQYNTHKQNLEKKMEMLIKKIPDVSGLETTTDYY